MLKNIKIIVAVAVVAISQPMMGQRSLTLDDFHRLALQSNKAIKILDEQQQGAEDLRKMALTEFFPKFSANGMYHWSEKNIELLSDNQKQRLSHMGDEALSSALNNFSADLVTLLGILPNAVNMGNTVRSDLNGLGQQIVEDFDVDTRNIFIGAVSVTQPIYMGGKIREAYRIAKLNKELAGLQYDKGEEELLIGVDEAYWRVVSLTHKVELATQYCALLEELSRNVDAMVEAEVATAADQTKVRVKLNEAQMSLSKATNGLALCKMLLYQMCGLDLDGDYVVVEDSSMVRYEAYPSINMQEVWNGRSEIRMLQIAEEVARSGVRLAASGFQPHVGLMGSYMVSNPSFYNGISNTTAGMFTIGVAAHIPLCHADNFYAVRVAKHKRNQAVLQMEEAKEKIELQVNKLNYELEVANKKLTQAESNLSNAEENLKLARESFDAGIISSNDLMAAQTAWMKAKSEVVDAEVEIRMGYRNLQHAMGIKK